MRWEGEVCRFQQGEEVLGCGRAGECDGIRVVFGGREKGADGVDGAFRDDRTVGRGDGDFGARSAEGFGEVVAGGFGTDEKETGWGAVGLVGVDNQGRGKGFGYSFLGDKGRNKADGSQRPRSGWADGGGEAGSRVQGPGLRLLQHLKAMVEGFYGVGAGEKEPVEALEMREGFVERGIGRRGGEFDGGDEDGIGAEGTQSVGQFRGLVGGASDEDAGFGHGRKGLLRLAESEVSEDLLGTCGRWEIAGLGINFEFGTISACRAPGRPDCLEDLNLWG